MVACRYNCEYISLVCALFAYGKATQIVKFLDSLDFDILDKDEPTITKSLQKSYYRFQNSQDIITLFVVLSQMKKTLSLNKLFTENFAKTGDIIDSIQYLIKIIKSQSLYSSRGFEFLVGSSTSKTSAYKRWNLFLRWMVRYDNLDMGLWRGLDKKHLLMPLDTHTFNLGKKLKLIQTNTPNQKAVYELTNALRKFDPSDPVKYDFALYRLGQEGVS